MVNTASSGDSTPARMPQLSMLARVLPSAYLGGGGGSAGERGAGARRLRGGRVRHLLSHRLPQRRARGSSQHAAWHQAGRPGLTA